MINFIKLSEVQKDDLSKVTGGATCIALYAVRPPILDYGVLDYGIVHPDYGIVYPDYGVMDYGVVTPD